MEVCDRNVTKSEEVLGMWMLLQGALVNGNKIQSVNGIVYEGHTAKHWVSTFHVETKAVGKWSRQ